MSEGDANPLNAGVPAVESVRRLLSEAERSARELADLNEELAARSEAARRDAERLIAELEDAKDALAGSALGAWADDPPAPEPAPAKPPGPASDGARMLARQMRASGASREEAERDLRKTFGIANAEAVVDSVFDGG